MKSYLTNRKLYVQIGDNKREEKIVDIGVPQGSIKAPLLFAIYINDFERLPLNGKFFMFADDICIIHSLELNRWKISIAK